MNKTLAAALQYASLGWYVAPLWGINDELQCCCGRVPCDSAGKHPQSRLTPNGLKQASREPAVIRSWWASDPGANLAVVTGPSSRLVVIDIDPRNGGELAMSDLEHDLGEQLDTLEVFTGGGGRHLYYRYPDDRDISSRSNALGCGVDVKGRGGYVVAPPSLHQSGELYDWKVGPDDGKEGKPPAKLLARLDEPKAKADVEDGGEIAKGSRNQALFALGASMRRHGAGFATISAALLDTNASRCVPPCTSQEVERIAKSCASYEPPDPLLANPQQIVELWRAASQDTPVGYCLSITEYAGDGPPPDESEDFWVGAIMPKAAPVVIAGPPKSAKSLFTLDLGIAMGLGEETFLGQPCTQAKVLFLPLEDPQRTTQRRIWQLCAGRGIKPSELEGRLAVDSNFGFYFNQSKYIGALRKAMDRFEPDVVIVDSLARSFLGDENSKEGLGEALGPWQDLVRATGVTIAVIHHFRKSTVDQDGVPLPLGMRLRGSGDLFAFVRQVVGVSAMGPKYPRTSKVETSGNFETQLEPPVAFKPMEVPADGWDGLSGRRLVCLGSADALQSPLEDDREDAVRSALSGGPESANALLGRLKASGVRMSKRTLEDMLERMGCERIGSGRATAWRLRDN